MQNTDLMRYVQRVWQDTTACNSSSCLPCWLWQIHGLTYWEMSLSGSPSLEQPLHTETTDDKRPVVFSIYPSSFPCNYSNCRFICISFTQWMCGTVARFDASRFVVKMRKTVSVPNNVSNYNNKVVFYTISMQTVTTMHIAHNTLVQQI